MGLPYKLATLLYCFNGRDEVLLLERAQEPNLGLWSPCGGKLRTDAGESPYACACREAQEELGLALSQSDLHLTGLASEHGYQGQSHWLMFLFEVKRRSTDCRPCIAERLSICSLVKLKSISLSFHLEVWDCPEETKGMPKVV